MTIEYRDNSYFKENEWFLFKDLYDKFFTAQVKMKDGYWFTETNLSYKATSLPSLNCTLTFLNN